MEKVIGGALIGAAAVVAGPAIVDGTVAAGRFLAKSVIKAGIITTVVATSLVTVVGRQCSQLYDEARAELEGRPLPGQKPDVGPQGESTIERVEHAVVEEVIEREAVQVLETLIMAAL
jgi:hypothetical protein